MPLTALFLDRQVLVKAYGYKAQGKLIHYTQADKTNHITAMLILITPSETTLFVDHSH